MVTNKMELKEYFSVFNLIKTSGLFDEKWYSKTYLKKEDVNPILHYLIKGYKYKYEPSPYFDTKWYLKDNKDIKKSDMIPFVHYVIFGRDEGRLPIQYKFDSKFKSDYAMILNSGLFDYDWFSGFYSLDSKQDPILYYLENGVKLGLNPSRHFDTKWYLKKNNDVNKSNVNPFVHYVTFGRDEGRLPILYKFDSKFKLEYYEIINSHLLDYDWFSGFYSLSSNQDPIIYYLKNGVKLGLNPSPSFDTEVYLKDYPDVKNNNIDPLVHYIEYGMDENRIFKPVTRKKLSKNYRKS